MRQIRRWQQAQLVYMPGATTLPDDDADENETGELETPENIPLVLPSGVDITRRDMVCLHQVAEYERQLRLAQLQDSLVELRCVRRIRHTLLINHRTQVAGQGQRANTRSRTVISSIEERIAKFAQRYRVAYKALTMLDPDGTWQTTFLELRDEDNRGPGKEQHEKGPGDGSYTFSWIWLQNPRARDMDENEAGGGEGGASEEEVNEVIRVQWATSHARMKRWVEEVELLQEEMRRMVTFLEWRSGDWLDKQDVRLATASPSIQSGLEAYARKQAAIHHDLAVSFSKLWYPTLVSHGLNHSWVTEFTEKHGIPLLDNNVPTSRAGVSNGTNEGSSEVGTNQPVQIQGPSDAVVDDEVVILEEIPYVEDDDSDEGYSLEPWISFSLDPDSDNDSDDASSDFDFDFD
jgi:hypothetical protein